MDKKKYILIDTDADFDDLTSILWSALLPIKNILRTIGNGYSTPLTVRTSTGGTAAWIKNNNIKNIKVYVGLDCALPKTINLGLYNKPSNKIIQFTTMLSESLLFGLNKKTIILYQSKCLPSKYNANINASIIILGPLTNIAAIDSKLWNNKNCPHVFISSNQIFLPLKFPIFVPNGENITIDPVASMKVFKRTTKCKNISILICHHLTVEALIEILERVLRKKIPKKNRLVAQRILDTLLYTQKFDPIPPIYNWDLTTTVVTLFPFLIKNKILCDVSLCKKGSQLILTPSKILCYNNPKVYIAAEIDLDLALNIIEVSFLISTSLMKKLAKCLFNFCG